MCSLNRTPGPVLASIVSSVFCGPPTDRALDRPVQLDRVSEAASFRDNAGRAGRSNTFPERQGRSRNCDYALGDRPSTGRGKWAAGCFPNARGVHSFLACRDPPANFVHSFWTAEARHYRKSDGYRC
jgi:hypothetical protein